MYRKYSIWFIFIVIWTIACGRDAAPLPPDAKPVGEKKITITDETKPPTNVLIPPLSQHFIDNIKLKKFHGSDIVKESIYEDSAAWRIERVYYESTGLKITALLGIPKKYTLPRPAVLLCHGYYPPKDYFQGQGTLSTIEGLCSEGYVVFVPDYRGYWKSEGRYSSSFPGELYDVMNAYYSLQSYKGAIKNKIFLLGYSWGGGFAATAAEVIGTPAGLINFYGQLGGIKTPERQAAFYRSKGASDEEIKYVFNHISPIYNAKYINAPVLLIHGERDTTVKPEQSEQFYKALKLSGKDVVYKTFPEYPHAFGDNYNNKATPLVLEFLKKYSTGK